MPKSTTQSFILELPLVVCSGEERTMLGRFEAGRRLYNTVLDEALKRLNLMRESRQWQKARDMPKGKERSAAFKDCNTRFGFTEYDLHTLAIRHKNAAGWQDRLGAHETQKIASRTWKSVQEYAFGQRGRPRFKSIGRPLHSLEGKSNQAGIRWKSDTGCVEWNKLVLPVRLPTKAQDPYLHEGLQAKTKYSRIVWRLEKGRRRWFLQLIQEGLAPAKYDFQSSGRVIGLDLGPSVIAIVSDNAAGLEKFAPSVDQPWTEIRRMQRVQDRSRRAANPDNYHANGTVKKGAKIWKKSKRYKVRQARLAETERRLAEARKRDHGELCNRILSLGNVIQTEKLSYKAFQRNFGKSSKVRAPGMFVTQLTRKAESAGGKVVELDTRRLSMSQYDHVLGTCEKKPLSQRWHRLGGTGTLVQRDIYSAFLAQNANEGGHNPTRLKEGWAAQEPALRRAGLCLEQSASGTFPKVPTVVLPSERIARQRRPLRGLNRDVVGIKPENPETPRFMNAFGTPCL